MMKKLAIILMLILILCGCKKSVKDSPITDCKHNNFVATVSSSLYQANELSINTSNCGSNPPCFTTNIFARQGKQPHDVFFTFDLTNSVPGTYYLGKLGVKRDNNNYYTGDVSYIINYSPSLSEGYQTDSIYNGILMITKKDEAKRQIYGTFSFTARKLMTNDTTLISVSNGNFQGCY